MSIKITPEAIDLVVFSVDNPQDEGFLFLAGSLRCVKITPCTGSYKGVEEKSFMMKAVDFVDLMNHIHPLPWQKQESTLHLGKLIDGKRRNAFLVDRDFNISFLGVWQEVTEVEAKKHEGWTHCECGCDTYFTCLEC